MPIIVGNIVAVHRTLADLTRGAPGQAPRLGRIGAVAAGLVEILWADGTRSADVNEDALDVISSGASLSTYFGHVVELDVNAVAAYSPSGSYDATVCSVFTRDQAGDGDTTDELILCKLLNSDVYIETLLANATILDNR